MKRLAIAILAVCISGSVSFAADSQKDKRLANAEKLANSRDYESAKILLNAVLEDKADDYDALYLRGSIHEKLSDAKSALDDYYACIDAIAGNPEMDTTDRRLLAKAREAVDRLDKARGIVLKYAKNIEDEAKKFERKDPLTTQRLTEVSDKMKELVDKVPELEENKEKDYAKVLKKNTQEFYELLFDEKYDEAVKFFNPRAVAFIGKNKVIDILKMLGAGVKAGVKSKKDMDIGKVFVEKDGKLAIVFGKYRFGGKWVNSDDPICWERDGGNWYIIDKKDIKEKD